MKRKVRKLFVACFLRGPVKGIAFCSYVFPQTDWEMEKKSDIDRNKKFQFHFVQVLPGFYLWLQCPSSARCQFFL